MNENIEVSVILPVYNAEIYLRKCISSILQQTYKDLEVILVNDGSIDSSGRIAQEIADQDIMKQDMITMHQLSFHKEQEKDINKT